MYDIRSLKAFLSELTDVNNQINVVSALSAQRIVVLMLFAQNQKPPWEYLDSEWHSVTVHMYIVHTYVQFNIEYQRNDPKYDKEVIKAMSVEC